MQACLAKSHYQLVVCSATSFGPSLGVVFGCFGSVCGVLSLLFSQWGDLLMEAFNVKWLYLFFFGFSFSTLAVVRLERYAREKHFRLGFFLVWYGEFFF